MKTRSTISFADKMKAAKAAKAERNRAEMAEREKAADVLRAQATKPIVRGKKITPEVADKRLKGLLTVHGVPEIEANKIVEKRRNEMVHVATIRQTLNLETGEKSEPVMTIADGGPPTISRTYQREFKGNGATQRGKMMQITVTFTPDQFNVLVERARLYGSSLAETVRKCVLSGPLHSLSST